MNESTTAILLAAVLTAGTALAQGTAPRFMALGQMATPPDGYGTNAAAVSGDGMVVVGSAYDGAHMVAARWSSLGWQGMPWVIAGTDNNTSNYAQATNRDGSVMSGMLDGTFVDRGFIWKAATGAVVMPVLPTGQRLYSAKHMSSNGLFVTGSSDTSSGTRPYRYDLVLGQMVNLTQAPAPIAGATGGSADTMNDDGSMVLGGYSTSTQSVSSIWTPSSGFLPPPAAPPGGTNVTLGCISGDGTILGGGCIMSGVTGRVPVRWVNGTPQTLTIPSGMNDLSGIALGSADGGTMLGTYRFPTGPSSDEFRPFLWRSDLGIVPLYSYITDTLGLSMQGVSNLSVNGISADGKVLVGEGRRNNRWEGWMLRLPGAFPLCAADVGSQGGLQGGDGLLDNNDFVVFIADFFTLNARADMGKQGGLPGGDGHFDNNDFVVFINSFFTACN